jgi:hypothetical protein
MPKPNLGKGKANGKPATGGFSDVTFISFPLDAQQKKQLKETVWTLDDFDTELCNLNDDGYKVSFNYDDYNDCYGCFITPGKGNTTNAGFILTGRGSSPWKAFRQAAYVHVVLFEKDWSGWRDTRRGEQIDD